MPMFPIPRRIPWRYLMLIKLRPDQQEVVDKLKSGSILCGGVGSGKSITALSYYFLKECGGILDKGFPVKMEKPKDLYIITTAKKRNTFEWEHECANFLITSVREDNIGGIKMTIDSWNNIKKYTNVENAFFIFDEQRVVGAGAWVKAFLQITKKNQWILLSATPGDTWIDYVPVFIANGFYKNRSEFIRRHVIYRPMSRYPQIDRYIDCDILVKYKASVLVLMDYVSKVDHDVQLRFCKYDEQLYKKVVKENWDVFNNEPLTTASKSCYTLRKIVNENPDRLQNVLDILNQGFRKVVIFYNFNYELDQLKTLSNYLNITVAEYNGNKHDSLPSTDRWVYLVQYSAGCEGWNCIETNCIIFYSLNYSYKVMHQAAGRIDRANTPFKVLHYFVLRSRSSIDERILYALKNKKRFNEQDFSRELCLAEITACIMERKTEYA